jgi:hypothetical protein
MGEHREVVHERLYVKEPGTERFRKSAAARLRYMLSTGWRETERWHAQDYLTVRMERTGVVPKMTTIPKPPPMAPRERRGGFGGPGGPGGGPRGPRR